MSGNGPENVFEVPSLRGRVRIFHDRPHAGEILASMLEGRCSADGLVMAIPSGGVPVGAEVARHLGLPLDVAAVSKITPPSNSEIGYGAVAFDGSVFIREPMRRQLGLSDAQVEIAVAETREKVRRRMEMFRADRPLPVLSAAEVIVVDDGLASGVTMSVAVRALTNAGAGRVIVAVPTAHEESIVRIRDEVVAVYCANIRGGWQYAVAEAYCDWRDVPEAEAARIFRQHMQRYSRGS